MGYSHHRFQHVSTSSILKGQCDVIAFRSVENDAPYDAELGSFLGNLIMEISPKPSIAWSQAAVVGMTASASWTPYPWCENCWSGIQNGRGLQDWRKAKIFILTDLDFHVNLKLSGDCSDMSCRIMFLKHGM